LQFAGFAFDFLVDLRDRFSDKIESLLDSFDGRIEMATRLGVRICVLLANACDRRIYVTSCLRVRACILLPNCFEQLFQIFVSHALILR